MQGDFLFLGTGPSTGIPLIGCHCEVCSSKNPQNQRLRPSAFLNLDGKKILIDSGPDFRLQALRYGIEQIDGVLLTHAHFDHIAGLDELRIFFLRSKKKMPILLSAATYEDLRQRYTYLFLEKNPETSLTAQLDFHVLPSKRGNIDFLGLNIGYTSYVQGTMPVTGFRFGTLAYISDIRIYPESIFEDLFQTEILILSALRETPSYMHLSIEEAISFSQKIAPQATYFTHLGHEVEHVTISEMLPKGVYLSYDGLKLDFMYG